MLQSIVNFIGAVVCLAIAGFLLGLFATLGGIAAVGVIFKLEDFGKAENNADNHPSYSRPSVVSPAVVDVKSRPSRAKPKAVLPNE